MNKIPAPMVILTREIALITRTQDRSARRMVQRIRKEYKLPAKSPITIDNFCRFTGLPEKKVREFLQ